MQSISVTSRWRQQPQHYNSTHYFLPCNSDTNSQEVGPPPTTTKDKRRLISASHTVGTAAFSKTSMTLFLMARACFKVFKKKMPSPSWMVGIPNVFVVTPTAMTSLSYSISNLSLWTDSTIIFLVSGSRLRALACKKLSRRYYH
jgi:hypothetical protein